MTENEGKEIVPLMKWWNCWSHGCKIKLTDGISFTLMTTGAKAQVLGGWGQGRVESDNYDQTFNASHV